MKVLIYEYVYMLLTLSNYSCSIWTEVCYKTYIYPENCTDWLELLDHGE